MSKPLRLFQRKDGFRYTSDTMFLYDFISRFGVKGKVLDAGAGCGILGFLLAREHNIELTSIEILPSSYELCLSNAANNDISANILNCNFLEYISDKFDFIVSNPPFYYDKISKSECEKMQSARYSQGLPLDKFFIHAKKLLRPKGELIFCFDARRLDEIFLELAKTKNLKPIAIQFLHAKGESPSKLVMVRAKLDSKASLEIIPPIFATQNGVPTKEAKEIYERANCESVDVD